MELHQLEAFSAVMSAGSVTGAGELLGRSQPAVTRQIQELEADLGYALFDRHGPRVTPTRRAFLLYDEVERSLVGLRAIEARARALGDETAEPVRIAATPSLAAALVPAALAALPDGAHAPHYQLRSESAEHVVHEVLAGTADIGVVTLPIAHAGLDVHWIAQARCVAVLAAADPLATKPRITLRDLAQRRIVTVANRHRLRQRIDAALAAARVDVRVFVETNASLNAVMAARAALGIAIVDPATGVALPVEGVVVRPLDADIPFAFGVATPAGKPRTASVDALLDALQRTTRTLLDGVIFHDASVHDAWMRGDRPRTDGDARPARATRPTRSTRTAHARGARKEAA
ncbi:TPA: LysR family transcriptional regulator [Burkholderia vietnamiensis]|nr:LysR family transcriptional regulator [Burkholderia vietnamiensis]HEP6274715.1 LysR family transcriptional regulator [Burkholderia vietnamiensis]HEP6282838.1 LysR family transcriptional regulator [Burkholderia vietnamiensis]HEP6307474.1 LysR family transcriptional regulator [Burkholderia vietnamiensis]